MPLKLFIVVPFFLLHTACASRPIRHGAPAFSKAYGSMTHVPVDVVRQTRSQDGGAAALLSVGRAWKAFAAEGEDLALLGGPCPHLGCSFGELQERAKALGFQSRLQTWTLSDALERISMGAPLICRIGENPSQFVVLMGHDDTHVLLMNPRGFYQRMDKKSFEGQWQAGGLGGLLIYVEPPNPTDEISQPGGGIIPEFEG
ncbi:MAG: hypothetical protein JJU29_22395 [Verrucomicrobia bacterium]|nr:hypothetical protein [Verrucomicrobiota bacterium]MCH8513177.1 hypothetical protein [Kiritimatiellia bacterium]